MLTDEERRERSVIASTNWKKKNKEKSNAASAAWKKAHPEVDAAWRAAHKESRNASSLKWDQNHREVRAVACVNRRVRQKEAKAGRSKPKACEVCGDTNQKIHFDHCHISGKFRGWLCRGCNVALGCVKDSPTILRKLAKYLEATR